MTKDEALLLLRDIVSDFGFDAKWELNQSKIFLLRPNSYAIIYNEDPHIRIADKERCKRAFQKEAREVPAEFDPPISLLEAAKLGKQWMSAVSSNYVRSHPLLQDLEKVSRAIDAYEAKV